MALFTYIVNIFKLLVSALALPQLELNLLSVQDHVDYFVLM